MTGAMALRAGLACVIIAYAGLLAGCSDDDGPSGVIEDTATKSDCQGCHLDKEMLIATAAPDTLPPPEDGGAG